MVSDPGFPVCHTISQQHKLKQSFFIIALFFRIFCKAREIPNEYQIHIFSEYELLRIHLTFSTKFKLLKMT